MSIDTGVYIVIFGRQFYIGMRSKYGSHTYPLNNDEFEELKRNFPKVKLNNVFDNNMFIDEEGTEEDRAEWKPYIRFNKKEYNILNSNCNALKKSTAIMISKYLSKLGYNVLCECLGRSSNNKIVLNDRISQKITPLTGQQSNPKKEVHVTQLSIFEII